MAGIFDAIFDDFGLDDLIDVGVSVIGAKMGSDAAGKAAAAEAQGANDSAALQREFYYRNRADLAPYQDVGTNALYNLAALHGVEYANAPGNFEDRARTAASRFLASPAYNFRLGEGVRALDRSAAARGQLLSGAQTKAVQGYGQNLASAEYGNYLNRLANLAGVGQTASSSAATLGANAGARIGNALYNAGAARASGYAGRADAVKGGVRNALYGFRP
jgi:hypothetical protein